MAEQKEMMISPDALKDMQIDINICSPFIFLPHFECNLLHQVRRNCIHALQVVFFIKNKMNNLQKELIPPCGVLN